jgi:Flp pilus assembly protein TadD
MAGEEQQRTQPPVPARRSRQLAEEYAVSALVLMVVLVLVLRPLVRDSPTAPARGFAEELESGLAALRQGDDASAIEHFTAAVEIDPDSPVAQLDLGIALLRAGRHREALPVCEKAVALAPDNLDARHNLGFANLMVGRHAEAIDLLEGVAFADGNRAVTWYELGVAYLGVGAREQARASFEKVLTLEPGHTSAQQRWAELATAAETASPP